MIPNGDGEDDHDKGSPYVLLAPKYFVRPVVKYTRTDGEVALLELLKLMSTIRLFVPLYANGELNINGTHPVWETVCLAEYTVAHPVDSQPPVE